jgi:hypothetical protein
VALVNAVDVSLDAALIPRRVFGFTPEGFGFGLITHHKVLMPL